MRSVKICSSLFWILFSVVVSREAFRLPMGEMKDPGAGFFPLMIGLLMMLLALIALFQSIREKKEGPRPQPQESFRWWNIVIILAALIAYALTLERVGFLINIFLFMLLLLKVIEPQTWKRAVLAGLTTAIVSDLFFNVILGAQIPSGILGF
jgi:putative tricarboxylic transport membrane protein